jgi:magnesium chelatase family protein
MVAKISSLGVQGIRGYRVEAECYLAGGLPAFDIVGLPDAAVKESRERVRAAARNCGYDFPARRITVNLAPADTKKVGSLYDLPVLLSLLQCMGMVEEQPENCYFIGELSLEGYLRGVSGVLPMALSCPPGSKLFLPSVNAVEASLCRHLDVYAAEHVKQIIDHLNNSAYIPLFEPPEQTDDDIDTGLDFADVRGQDAVKRAMEIAAAGYHSILIEGPPGAGKSMLATRLPSILPPLSYNEALEVTAVYSVSGLLPNGKPILKTRPFRSPHHTSSDVSIVGGGAYPKPGEVSLAHHGILFLDELPEFSRQTLEVLRQPLESGEVHISRVNGSVSYPCRFMLVSAMNPCPCGWNGFGDCHCGELKVRNYRNRISGPLLDRMDLHVQAPPVKFDELQQFRPSEPSEAVRQRVIAARSVQEKRFGCGDKTNADLTGQLLRETCVLDKESTALLRSAFTRYRMSGRAHARILRVSRTIADLAGCENIAVEHLAEALQYRGWITEE